LPERYRVPPAAEQLEIAVLGRGMGESILCHIGDSKWVIIDSFRSSRGVPIASEYLQQLDGDHEVVAVVVSHWDDDHIHGMGALVEQWMPNQVWLPTILRDQELVAFAVEHDEAMAGVAPSGLKEFLHVMQVTKGQGIRRWGSQGHSIATTTPAVMTLLSPTHEFIDEALTVLGINHAPGEREVTSVRSNRTSIVLWVQMGGATALLGADLEATSAGWSTVVGAHDVSRPSAGVMKVPHHGSGDADDQRVWDIMVDSRAFNVATRYTRLKEPLPRPDDVKRLLDRTGGLFVVGELSKRLRTESTAYDLHLDAASTDGIRALGQVGVVRLRHGPEMEWRCETFGAVEVVVGCGVGSDTAPISG